MTRTLSNPKRGCGHLKHGKAYIRGVIGSPDGVLSPFVRMDPPIPYREMGTDETFTRGYLRFDGTAAQFRLNQLADFVRCYPGDLTDADARENMVARGLYPDDDAIPDGEPQRHVDRIAAMPTSADHFGEVDLAAHGKRPHADLLMRVGATHYPDPDDFIDEAIRLGISKAIPLSKRQDPPVIDPGNTRVWVIHPDTDVGWGVIGFAYLQEVVYTQQEDGTVPDYIQDHAAAGELDVVDIEPPREHEDDTGLDQFTDDDGDRDGGEAADADETPGGDAAEHVVPSDKDGRDVEAVDTDDPDISIDDVHTRGDAAATVELRDAWDDWVDRGQYDYNDLKSFAATLDLDVDQHPSQDDLLDALAADLADAYNRIGQQVHGDGHLAD